VGNQCISNFGIVVFFGKYTKFSFCIDGNLHVLPPYKQAVVLRTTVMSVLLHCFMTVTLEI